MALTHRGRNVQNLIEDGRRDPVRTHNTQKWDIVRLYLKGHQHLRVDPNNENALKVDMANKARVVVNKMLPGFRSLMGKMTPAFPKFGVTPMSMSWEDIMKALANETALHAWWEADRIERKIRKGNAWTISTGNVGLHTYYDPGKKMVWTDIIKPYDLILEKGITETDESTFRCIRRLHDRHALADAYQQHRDVILRMHEATRRENYRGIPEHRVETREIHFTDGTYFILLETGLVLFQGQDVAGKMPIQIIKHDDLPDEPWGEGALFPVVHSQNQLNFTRAQQMKYLAVNVNSPWIIARNANVGPIHTGQNQKIFWNGIGAPPQRATVPAMGGDTWNNVGLISSEIDDQMSLHQISRGQRAPGLRSGSAINAVAARDDAALAAAKKNWEEGIADAGTVALLLMKEHYDEGVMVRQFDTYGRVISKIIKQTEFVDNPDVRIQPGSLFNDDIDAQNDMIMQLYQLQLMTPEQTMESLTLRNLNQFRARKMRDISHAQDLLSAARLGLLIEIDPLDDMKVMRDVFGDFRRSLEFYALPFDIQEYINEIYVSIMTYGMDSGAFNMAMQDKVFPRTSQPGAAGMEQAHVSSPQGRQQMQLEQQEAAVRREAAKRSGPEQSGVA